MIPPVTSASMPPRWLLSVFVVALLVRGGWGTFRFVRAPDPSVLEFPDERQYWLMADSLRTGEGLKDELGFRATRMPLYPAALSPFTGISRGVIAAKAVQWVIGAVAAVLTAGLAAALVDRRVGLLAGLLVAFDPFLVFFSSLLLTETVFVTLLAGFWWLMLPCIASNKDEPRPSGSGNARPERTAPLRSRLGSARSRLGSARSWLGSGRSRLGSATALPPGLTRWVVVGLVAALCVYTRESGAGLVAVALCFVAACRRFDRSALIGSAVAGGIVVAALLPWAVRNRRVIGDWCWLTTRGGISLYDGVGPQATGASNLGEIEQMPAVSNLNEVEWNRYFLNQSLQAIKADPGRIVRLAGTKLARMWNPFPNVQTYRSRLVRIVSAAWTLPALALGAVGATLLSIRDRRDGLRIAMFLLLPAIYLSALHSLFVGSVRYRLGAMVMIEILAALALVATADRITNYRLRITKKSGVVNGD